MVKCNQICPWNYYEIGCKKPNDELCPMSNLATKEKPQTNADRIRAMSDEELAELFGAILREREIILLRQLKKQGIEASIVELPDETFNAHLEWLKQPAEESQ